jgi:hypothetical protein
MFQSIRADPPPDQVRRITFVPFLADGRCVLIDEPGGPALPAGEVLDGEHYLLDTVPRIPRRRPDQRRRPPRPPACPHRLDSRPVRPGGRRCRRQPAWWSFLSGQRA